LALKEANSTIEVMKKTRQQRELAQEGLRNLPGFIFVESQNRLFTLCTIDFFMGALVKEVKGFGDFSYHPGPLSRISDILLIDQGELVSILNGFFDAVFSQTRLKDKPHFSIDGIEIYLPANPAELEREFRKIKKPTTMQREEHRKRIETALKHVVRPLRLGTIIRPPELIERYRVAEVIDPLWTNGTGDAESSRRLVDRRIPGLRGGVHVLTRSGEKGAPVTLNLYVAEKRLMDMSGVVYRLDDIVGAPARVDENVTARSLVFYAQRDMGINLAKFFAKTSWINPDTGLDNSYISVEIEGVPYMATTIVPDGWYIMIILEGDNRSDWGSADVRGKVLTILKVFGTRKHIRELTGFPVTGFVSPEIYDEMTYPVAVRYCTAFILNVAITLDKELRERGYPATYGTMGQVSLPASYDGIPSWIPSNVWQLRARIEQAESIAGSALDAYPFAQSRLTIAKRIYSAVEQILTYSRLPLTLSPASSPLGNVEWVRSFAQLSRPQLLLEFLES
jgi:hypothetical protein